MSFLLTPSTGTQRIGVLGTGSYLPAAVRSNEDVAAATGVTPEWIEERTGVRKRHMAASDEAASDLPASVPRN
jgi:3-oxoacyl-[acyl-carrier-protein] synthase-3